jgi:hypothetical protein
MQVYLSLRRSGYRLVYGIPIWYRVVSSTIALVLLGAAVGSGGLGVFGTVLMGIALFAALYEERWVFDGDSGTCACRTGLVFVAKGPSFAFKDVARLRLDVFAKGRLDQKNPLPEEKLPPGSQVRLIIETMAGESFMIDSAPVRRKPALAAVASEIAATLGIPLEE